MQFKKSPPKVPYRAIALAVFLFVIGSLLIILGALLLSETIKVEVSVVSVFWSHYNWAWVGLFMFEKYALAVFLFGT